MPPPSEEGNEIQQFFTQSKSNYFVFISINYKTIHSISTTPNLRLTLTKMVLAMRNMTCSAAPRVVARAPSSSSAFMGHTVPQQHLRLAAPRPTRQVTRMGLFGLGVPEIAVIAGVIALIYGMYIMRISSEKFNCFKSMFHSHSLPPPPVDVVNVLCSLVPLQVPASFLKSAKDSEKPSRAFKQQQRYELIITCPHKASNTKT